MKVGHCQGFFQTPFCPFNKTEFFLSWNLLFYGEIFFLSSMYISYHYSLFFQFASTTLEAGVTAPYDPVQDPLVSPQQPFLFKHYKITPLASFQVLAKVLSKRRYDGFFSGDKMGNLSPIDLALGWKQMSDALFLGHIDIVQFNRFYFFTFKKSIMITKQSIARHSANMHIIPANKDIAKRVFSIHHNDLIQFSGYLVMVTGKNSVYWRSSLTRDDTGDGACELVFVQSFKVVDAN